VIKLITQTVLSLRILTPLTCLADKPFPRPFLSYQRNATPNLLDTPPPPLVANPYWQLVDASHVWSPADNLVATDNKYYHKIHFLSHKTVSKIRYILISANLHFIFGIVGVSVETWKHHGSSFWVHLTTVIHPRFLCMTQFNCIVMTFSIQLGI